MGVYINVNHTDKRTSDQLRLEHLPWRLEGSATQIAVRPNGALWATLKKNTIPTKLWSGNVGIKLCSIDIVPDLGRFWTLVWNRGLLKPAHSEPDIVFMQIYELSFDHLDRCPSLMQPTCIRSRRDGKKSYDRGTKLEDWVRLFFDNWWQRGRQVEYEPVLWKWNRCPSTLPKSEKLLTRGECFARKFHAYIPP